MGAEPVRNYFNFFGRETCALASTHPTKTKTNNLIVVLPVTNRPVNGSPQGSCPPASPRLEAQAGKSTM